MESEGRCSPSPPPPPPQPPAAALPSELHIASIPPTSDQPSLESPPPPTPADPPPNAEPAASPDPDDLEEAMMAFPEAAASPPESDADGAASQDPQEPEAPDAATGLTEDLRARIVRQVEYYFSDTNLPTDKFMLKYVKRDKEGFVPIAVISTFKKMKKLVQDLSVIEAALRTSSQLVVSANGKKVKRLHPLPVPEVKDTKSHTVIVENLPEDCSKDYIQKQFGNIGNITNITIRDPHSTEESATTRKGEIAISSKLHALVEYETAEAAERAVASLNDEKNWRWGMRVELLIKRMGKFGLVQRGQRENLSGKDDANGQKSKSVDHQDESVQTEEDSSSGKSRRQGRYKGRGRGHLQQNTNGQGHGHVTSSSSSEGMNRPIPGPRMPDGTRGFAMGRGKPALKVQNDG